jgi:hypothetical protein
MLRRHRPLITLFAAVCLLLAATLGFACGLAENTPTVAAHCHDAAEAPPHGQHSQHGHGHSPTLCHAACCPGWAAALPAPVALPVAADAAAWSLSGPALRVGAWAADIFRPPRGFSSP